MSAAAPSLPTGLMPRFSDFINQVKRTMGDVMLYRNDTTPLAMLLWEFLSATQRRLAALHARFAAGKLPAAPRARRPAAEPETAERPRPEPRSPGIPPGPVLWTVFQAGFDGILQALLDDPEMRALLAASPQAGRLLRPLWRKLTPRPLPAVLRLPPRPRRAKAGPRQAGAAPAALSGPPASARPEPASAPPQAKRIPAWWCPAPPSPPIEPPDAPPPWPPPFLPA